MKIGIGSYAFRWAIGTSKFRPSTPLRPVDLLYKAKELGAAVVQYADNMPLDVLTNAEVDELARTAAHLGLSIEVGTSGCRTDRLLRYLQIALHLDSPLVRLVLDAPDAHPSIEEAVQILHEVVPSYRSARVQIAIENHFLMSSPALIGLVKAVDDPVIGVCLDTANSMGCQEWPLETVRMLAPYAINLHLKDYAIRPDPEGVGVIVTGAPLGQGRQQILPLLEFVLSQGRPMSVILEQWLPRVESEAETLQKEQECLQQSMAAMHRLMAIITK